MRGKKKDSGFTFRGQKYDPKNTFIQKVRHTMGWIIHEALDDKRVTAAGLDFLDRAFRH
jgi:hypothetical protein